MVRLKHDKPPTKPTAMAILKNLKSGGQAPYLFQIFNTHFFKHSSHVKIYRYLTSFIIMKYQISHFYIERQCKPLVDTS